MKNSIGECKGCNNNEISNCNCTCKGRVVYEEKGIEKITNIKFKDIEEFEEWVKYSFLSNKITNYRMEDAND